MLDTVSKQMLFGGAHFEAATHACEALHFEPGCFEGPELTCSALDRAWKALLPRKPRHILVQIGPGQAVAAGQVERWMLDCIAEWK